MVQLETKASKCKRQIWKVVVFYSLTWQNCWLENKSTNLSHLLEPKLCFQAVNPLERNIDPLTDVSLVFCSKAEEFKLKTTLLNVSLHRALRFLELCPWIFPRDGQAEPI